MGWILETNKNMNRGMEAMSGRVVKRYRVYEQRSVAVSRHAPFRALKASPPMFELPAARPFHAGASSGPRRSSSCPSSPCCWSPASTRVGALRRWACSLGGYAFWTLTEYWLHRVVFHFEPERGIGARLHWMIHGVHHDHPNDPLRLVMPPSAASRWR